MNLSRNAGGTVTTCAQAWAALCTSTADRMLPTIIFAGEPQRSSHSRTARTRPGASPPSSATRPAKMLTYVAPALAPSTAWPYERQAVRLTRIPCRSSRRTTPRQGRPCSLITGIFTTMLGAHPAKASACSTISSGSLPVTSTLTGRGSTSRAMSIARRFRSYPPSLSMMLGLVVTPSRTPQSSQRSISSRFAVSRNISISTVSSLRRFLDPPAQGHAEQVVQRHVPGFDHRRSERLRIDGDDDADVGAVGEVATAEAAQADDARSPLARQGHRRRQVLRPRSGLAFAGAAVHGKRHQHIPLREPGLQLLREQAGEGALVRPGAAG